MRFGIMAMQLGMLIPIDLAGRDVVDHVRRFSHAGLVRKLVGGGFHLIELGGDLAAFLPQTYSPGQIDELAVLKGDLGLTYTVHLPLWAVEPSTPLGPVREGSVRALVDAVRATAPLVPEVYVLHATGALASEFTRMALPPMGRALLLRQFQQAALHSLRALLDETALPSRQLAIETVEFPLDLTLEMAEALDLSICFDVGHVLSGFSGPLGVSEALQACAPRLAEVHLHDAVAPPSPDRLFYGRDHAPLGTGDLDIGAFLDQLTEVGFDGPVIFELKLPEAQASLAVVRSMRPALVSAP